MSAFKPIASGPIASSGTSENFNLSVTHGVYAVSYQGAGKLITDIYPSGTYSVNGRLIAFSAQRPIQVNSGTFVLEGQDITLKQGFGINAANGTFVLTGADVDVRSGFGLITEEASYSVAYQSINLNVSMSVDPYVYLVTGQNVAQKITTQFVSGAFETTGNDADLILSRMLSADNISYEITGNTVRFLGFLSLEPARPNFNEAVIAEEVWTDNLSEPDNVWTEDVTVSSLSWSASQSEPPPDTWTETI